MQKRILVVDDDSLNLRRTQMILEKQYDVVLAESGEQAIAKVIHQDFDLILLDIAMPDMDGLETYRV